MHFGHFLLRRGVVTPTQILAALDEQRRSSPYIGALAVGAGLMSVEQVLYVLDELNTHGSAAGHFGHIAVRLGYLDDAARECLLEMQRSRFVSLRDVLVRQGAVDPQSMASLTEEFEESAGPCAAERV